MTTSSSWLAASLGLDVAKLRTALDTLRGELAGPLRLSLSSVNVALLSDRDRITDSVRAVCHALGDVDLEARRALSGHMPRVHGSDADKLAGLVDLLPRLWVQRVHDTLGPAKTAVVRGYLAHGRPSLLEVLGRLHDENANSDVIRWLLDPRRAPTVAPQALSALADHLDDPAAWRDLLTRAARRDLLSVRREFVIGREGTGSDSLDRIDLVISGPGFVLAIENKLWSVEHLNQTRSYWDWLCRLPARSGGLFLTPAGLAAGCPDFRPVSYLELLSCLLEAPAQGPISTEEEYVLGGYVRSLAASILRTELRALRGGES